MLPRLRNQPPQTFLLFFLSFSRRSWEFLTESTRRTHWHPVPREKNSLSRPLPQRRGSCKLMCRCFRPVMGASFDDCFLPTICAEVQVPLNYCVFLHAHPVTKSHHGVCLKERDLRSICSHRASRRFGNGAKGHLPARGGGNQWKELTITT